MQPESPHGTVSRALEPRVRTALADTPIVVIQGARQVGKSTLAGVIGAAVGAVHVTLDDATTLAAARFDPAAFVEQAGPRCLVVDEAQRAPELVLALKAAVDRDRRPGRFLLTGSADLLRLGGDSLAGRAETLELWGFAQAELRGGRANAVDRLFAGELGFAGPGVGRRSLLEIVCAGSYPEVLARPTAARRAAWFASYVDRIAERDVHELSGLRFASLVPDILRVVGAHTAGVVSRATLARDIGMAEPTLPPYLELLESLRLVVRLPNWSGTAVSRARSRPKLLLADSGLAAWFAHASPASLGPGGDPDRAGRLVETFAVCELLKATGWSDTPVRAYHWRDRRQREVDLVLEAHDGRVVAVEVKASSSVHAGDFAGLRAFAEIVGERFAAGVVLHTGEHAAPFGERLAALPIDALWA
jgi:predicted AAA+ superfamily ATPase